MWHHHPGPILFQNRRQAGSGAWNVLPLCSESLPNATDSVCPLPPAPEWRGGLALLSLPSCFPSAYSDAVPGRAEPLHVAMVIFPDVMAVIWCLVPNGLNL